MTRFDTVALLVVVMLASQLLAPVVAWPRLVGGCGEPGNVGPHRSVLSSSLASFQLKDGTNNLVTSYVPGQQYSIDIVTGSRDSVLVLATSGSLIDGSGFASTRCSGRKLYMGESVRQLARTRCLSTNSLQGAILLF